MVPVITELSQQLEPLYFIAVWFWLSGHLTPSQLEALHDQRDLTSISFIHNIWIEHLFIICHIQILNQQVLYVLAHSLIALFV